MANRVQRVNSLLEKEISKILFKDFDFSDKALVTLTRVEASANLIEAKAYVSVLPDNKFDEILKTLTKGVYSVQQKINRTLKMRPVPKIKFVKDENIAQAGRIEELLAKVKDDIKD